MNFRRYGNTQAIAEGSDFIKQLSLTKKLREEFVSECRTEFWLENSFTKENLNLAADSEIKENYVLSVCLKKQEFDGRVIEAIAKQNPHKLIFLLVFENSCQLAVWYGKLYRTPWMEKVK